MFFNGWYYIFTLEPCAAVSHTYMHTWMQTQTAHTPTHTDTLSNDLLKSIGDDILGVSKSSCHTRLHSSQHSPLVALANATHSYARDPIWAAHAPAHPHCCIYSNTKQDLKKILKKRYEKYTCTTTHTHLQLSGCSSFKMTTFRTWKHSVPLHAH